MSIRIPLPRSIRTLLSPQKNYSLLTPHTPGPFSASYIDHIPISFSINTIPLISTRNPRHTLPRTAPMPWNDPHTAAPSLWAWQDAEGFAYECSATPLDASTNGRRGMKRFLLYRYLGRTSHGYRLSGLSRLFLHQVPNLIF